MVGMRTFSAVDHVMYRVPIRQSKDYIIGNCWFSVQQQCFVLDQHHKLNFLNASSLKQQSAGIHVAPLRLSWCWANQSSLIFLNIVAELDITTKVVSSNPTHGKVYWIQHFVIKLVSDLWQVPGFLWVLRFPPNSLRVYMSLHWDYPDAEPTSLHSYSLTLLLNRKPTITNYSLSIAWWALGRTIQRNWQHKVHKTICFGHHYTETNTNNINKKNASKQ
jgi:hypothetical protein